MFVVKTVREFNTWRIAKNNSIGFIPTLGALHDGHFSLIKASKSICDITVVSIFLNPTQFAPHEDLDAYPNTLDGDKKNLKQLGVDVLFLPSKNEMYKTVPDVRVPASVLFNKLEGKSRPHFFYGVTTIVSKLFNVIQPTHTFFGEKDAQQLRIIQEMIHKMNYSITLIPCPTMRDQNGLALSSRNQYLTSKEQKTATIIYQSLIKIKEGLNNAQSINHLKQQFKSAISTIPTMSVDYISIADSNSLDEVTKLENKQLLISTAVFLNHVRLIDNITYYPST
ncbi:MAG: pantoate--beta-alanine ligase [Candidatus Marinimicrobia bacterium]|nr:pantoate--beta-alanine ligase [Candidatus Neomarinimicrobiota bacterium]|tara:strand:- start:24982 stop:25824 length:843 start_codon:yes stop_codon:yes gene_type:complete